MNCCSMINIYRCPFQSPTPPQYVFWYHNNRMINYDTTRGSVTVQTDPSSTQSRLTIHQAVESDTGNYTCSASNTKPASIYVFVTEGRNISSCNKFFFDNNNSANGFTLNEKKNTKFHVCVIVTKENETSHVKQTIDRVIYIVLMLQGTKWQPYSVAKRRPRGKISVNC